MLKPGLVAHLVVRVNDDVLAGEPATLLETNVQLIMKNSEIVYFA